VIPADPNSAGQRTATFKHSCRLAS
jgi:hypothetical protein